MTRPSWDDTFMDICTVISKRSTCIKIQTAAILVKDMNIISIGYNGVPHGSQHCCDFFNANPDREEHHQWSLRNELHAEINAIVKCSGDCRGSTIYTLYSPCIHCAKSIIASKIQRVVYLHKYKRDYEVTQMLLLSNGIQFDMIHR